MMLIKRYTNKPNSTGAFEDLIVFAVLNIVYMGVPLLGVILSYRGYKKSGYALGFVGAFFLLVVLLIVLFLMSYAWR